MEKQRVVIYGTGSFAQYLAYIISHDRKYDVAGFCIEKEYLRAFVPHFSHLPLVDVNKVQDIFCPEKYKLFVAVGNNLIRERLYTSLKEKNYSFVSYISGKSIVYSDLHYKDNVFVSEDSGIQPFVDVGSNTIILGSKIGHHSSIGDNVLLSCCYVGGSSTIGNNTFIGLNATIKQNTVIAENNVIGMGCTITNNTKDGEVYSCVKSTVRRIVPSERLRKAI